MSHYVEGNLKTFTVGASDIPQGTLVKLSSGKVVAAAAATDVIIGVVNSKAYANGVIDVYLRSAHGTASVLAGGTIAVNDAVTSNASGQGITTTTAGNQIVGYALEAATVGKFVEVLPVTAKY
jgi:hypothetical protein